MKKSDMKLVKASKKFYNELDHVIYINKKKNELTDFALFLLMIYGISIANGMAKHYIEKYFTEKDGIIYLKKEVLK